MTPKQVAIKIFNNHLDIYGVINKDEYKYKLKLHSLVTINEILKNTITYAGKEYEFYTKVKQEIEKL